MPIQYQKQHATAKTQSDTGVDEEFITLPEGFGQPVVVQFSNYPSLVIEETPRNGSQEVQLLLNLTRAPLQFMLSGDLSNITIAVEFRFHNEKTRSEEWMQFALQKPDSRGVWTFVGGSVASGVSLQALFGPLGVHYRIRAGGVVDQCGSINGCSIPWKRVSITTKAKKIKTEEN